MTPTEHRRRRRPARPAFSDDDGLQRGRDPLSDRSLRRAQGRQARGPRAAAPGRQGDRADLREGLHAHALRVRGRRLRPGRARDVHRPERLAHGPQGDRQGHRPGARAHVRRDRVPRVRRGDRRRARAVGGRAGLQRPDRRVAPDADARRLPDDARAPRQALHADDATATSATPASTWPTATWRSAPNWAWTSASPRRARCGPTRPWSGPPRASPPSRRADHDHRGRRRGRPRLRLPAHRRVGLDGRVRRRLGRAHRAAHALPGQRAGDGGDRQPGRQVHALPAGVPQRRHRGRQGDSRRSSA